MPPCIAIFVRGGVVQEVASDTANVLIKLLDMDSLEEGNPPDQWRPPGVVIADRQDFEAYTSGGQTPSRHHPLSHPTARERGGFSWPPYRPRTIAPTPKLAQHENNS
jgi:hypothetical protein